MTPDGLARLFVRLLPPRGEPLLRACRSASIRSEEAEQRLETLLALPVGRRGWLGGRLLRRLPAGAAARGARGRRAGLGGRRDQGAERLALPRMLGAGANCLPVALLFLGLGALAYALAPAAGHEHRLRPRRRHVRLGAARRAAGRRRRGCSPCHPSTTSGSCPRNRSKPRRRGDMLAIAACAGIVGRAGCSSAATGGGCRRRRAAAPGGLGVAGDHLGEHERNARWQGVRERRTRSGRARGRE